MKVLTDALAKMWKSISNGLPWKVISSSIGGFIMVDVVGGLMPFWLGSLIGLGYGKWQLENFIGNGEIYIYSSGIFISVVYYLRNYRNDNMIISIIFWCAVVFLMAASGLFAAISIDIILDEIRFSKEYLIKTSKVLFIVSLICSIITWYYTERVRSFSLNDQSAADFAKLKSEFRRSEVNQ
jgi:hypothetical protein